VRSSPFTSIATGAVSLLLIATAAGAQQHLPPKFSQPCEITSEDYAVYSVLLDNLSGPEDPEEEWRDKTDFILEDTTVNWEKDNGVWGFRSSSKQAPSPQTMENYDARVRFDEGVKNVCLFKELFHAKKMSPHLVSRTDIDDLFKPSKHLNGWEKFYQLYPKSSGFWEFSPVGYNDDALEALVYVGHRCGYLCGTGHLFLLAKENGEWVVKNRTMLWIS
jgi:hypothetical protein